MNSTLDASVIAANSTKIDESTAEEEIDEVEADFDETIEAAQENAELSTAVADVSFEYFLSFFFLFQLFYN